MLSRQSLTENIRLPLWPEEPHQSAGSSANLAEAFRRLYYHLYTNSNASRAEKILGDLSLILLLKLAAEVAGGADELARYQSNGAPANDVLIPMLDRAFPGLVDTQQRFSLGEHALRGALDAISGITISKAPAHVLGEAFQALIGPRLRGEKGQFFTPQSLVRAMVQIVAPQPHESVLDPACGTGGFLVGAHIYQVDQAQATSPTGRLVGIDKDHDLSRLASALLQITTGSRSSVLNNNSFDIQAWPTTLADDESGCFDVVLTNPPFGARIGVREPAILQQYDLGHHWTRQRYPSAWQQTAAVVSSQDPQVLFLELCVRKLKPGGRLGIVLPEGVFGNKRQGYVWQWLHSQGRIFALLDCPRTTFQPGTDTKTNVLFFQKAGGGVKSRLGPIEQVRIAVALHCGHDRRGRTHTSDGQVYPDDFARLAQQFHAHQESESDWRQVTLNHPDYYVPRYYAKRRPLTRQERELTDGAESATLGELAQARLLTVRKGHEVGSEAYGTGEVPFVRTSDVSNFEISSDPTKSVSEAVYRRFAQQQQLQPGDILIVVDGRYRIGTTALLTEHNYHCVVQSHFRILNTPEPMKLDSYQLLFALNLPSVRMRIRDLVFIQSTLGTLGKRLLELRIPLLRGEGPWQAQVEEFKILLQKRDRFLSKLQTMSGTDFQL